MRILYLVHDLDDAAVRRRCAFLREGGAEIDLIGFRRLAPGSAGAPTAGMGGAGRVIGTTRNGRMGRRVGAVLRAMAGAGAWRADLARADAVVARNLEMLLIAVAARARAGRAVPIVYECLDIHRLLSGATLGGRILRALERRLLGACAMLVVSSPRFLDAHFRRFHAHLPRPTVLENKVLASELDGARRDGPARVPGPPWRIGWFGIIRCRRSLHLLADLVRRSNGAIEVDIRGRPARDAVPDFDAVVAATPGLHFGGAYDRARELPALYGRVHYNWAIDMFEDGLNSSWLLPNRLYEGSIFGAVPIARRDVETGRWLAERGCGVLLDAPLEATLPAWFAAHAAADHEEARRRVDALPPDALVETAASARSFVDLLGTLRVVPDAIPATLTRGQPA